MAVDPALDTSQIREWRSIVTLVVFVLTNINVLFPYHIPIPVPQAIVDGVLWSLRTARVIGPAPGGDAAGNDDGKRGRFVRVRFPMNVVTAPLIADLFLLAILAIGRQEVYDGTVGTDNIHPIDIMIFFITLAYIAISIDASGLIRYLAFKVLLLGGKVGHRLFFFLYAFFFALGTFVGNDPIILSGTAFLAYLTRVASNIMHPRAWIFTQFAIANIASAILVSSNPTNLVLAGAFQIKFITYTAYMIVPVAATAILLFPFLLYFVFADERLIPMSIEMHKLSAEDQAKKPINPNIPNGRGVAEEEENDPSNSEQAKLLSLEEIMNPFLDKGGAAFGGVVMAAALITVLALNASSQSGQEIPVYYVTLPAAVVMFIWDLVFGWIHRKETREIARIGRAEVQRAKAKQRLAQKREGLAKLGPGVAGPSEHPFFDSIPATTKGKGPSTFGVEKRTDQAGNNSDNSDLLDPQPFTPKRSGDVSDSERDLKAATRDVEDAEINKQIEEEVEHMQKHGPTTLVSLYRDWYRWCQETFPTVTAVLAHLPLALVPFAFSMFVLVQALVTKSWVTVFAYGWDHWVEKTGTVGAIGGMGFLAVLLCNFAGTNIGTTILLSRVIQSWQTMHVGQDGKPTISDRTFWATVYAMAVGVNYGAFSIALSASLAGMLWRDILQRKHINVRQRDFARVNLPIIAIAMTIGCVVLVGEMYIIKDNRPAEGGGFEK